MDQLKIKVVEPPSWWTWCFVMSKMGCGSRRRFARFAMEPRVQGILLGGGWG